MTYRPRPRRLVPGRITPEGSRRLRSRVVTLGPGESVGLHRTDGREELIIGLGGRPLVVLPSRRAGGRTIPLRPGIAVYLPEGVDHDVVNPGKASATYLYVVALFEDRPASHHAGRGGRSSGARDQRAGHAHHHG